MLSVALSVRRYVGIYVPFLQKGYVVVAEVTGVRRTLAWALAGVLAGLVDHGLKT